VILQGERELVFVKFLIFYKYLLNKIETLLVIPFQELQGFKGDDDLGALSCDGPLSPQKQNPMDSYRTFFSI
jgi:hypothetical protein